MRIRFLLALALVAVTVGAAPADASHSAPATYTGTIEGGGTVEFDVSADGTAVTRFAVTGFPGAPCATIVSLAIAGTGPAISGTPHSFSTPDYTGTFTGSQTATGTFRFRRAYPSCATPFRTWTATTAAPPAAGCRDGLDNDGDGRIDHPADPGCTGPSDTDEADPVTTTRPQGGGTVDRTPPLLTLSGRTPQRLGPGGTLAVGASCGVEACTVTAGGTVSVRGVAYKLRQARTKLAAGRKVTLRLKLTAKARVAVRTALRQRRKVVARISMVAVDAAGNRTTRTRIIRLRA